MLTFEKIQKYGLKEIESWVDNELAGRYDYNLPYIKVPLPAQSYTPAGLNHENAVEILEGLGYNNEYDIKVVKKAVNVNSGSTGMGATYVEDWFLVFTPIVKNEEV